MAGRVGIATAQAARMADIEKEQKTEQPTGKRLTEALERGQFARVPEMQMVFTMAAALTMIAFIGNACVERVGGFWIDIFSKYPTMVVRQDTVTGIFGSVLLVVGPIALPVLFASAGAALLAGGLQSGFNLTPKALGLKWERLNLTSGFDRIFSKQIFAHTGVELLKMVSIGAVIYLGARKLLLDPLFTAPIEIAYLGRFLNQAAIDLFSRLLFALGIVAAISYAIERIKTAKDLMMTKEEVREEQKSSEMDGKVKGFRRRLARRLMQKQMLSAVPTADVIVTNPTHYAVALKYERDKDKAPVVLAKGENRFARRIKALAEEHGVPTVENKPVARVLFALGRVGENIPPELYQAVAEILALVYRTHRYYFHRLRVRRIENEA
jgi:flagellar biosynthetic protein FlhB